MMAWLQAAIGLIILQKGIVAAKAVPLSSAARSSQSQSSCDKSENIMIKQISFKKRLSAQWRKFTAQPLSHSGRAAAAATLAECLSG